MNETLKKLICEMIAYDSGSPKRIQHFLKVHHFCALIASMEGVDEETAWILESAAIVHDIGIRNAQLKYNSHAGPLQEQEGPPEAEILLEKTGGYTREQIERIKFLIAHHHTYKGVDAIDWRILIEADFLVNLFESQDRYRAILNAEKNIFETASGKWILHTMFDAQN